MKSIGLDYNQYLADFIDLIKLMTAKSLQLRIKYGSVSAEHREMLLVA